MEDSIRFFIKTWYHATKIIKGSLMKKLFFTLSLALVPSLLLSAPVNPSNLQFHNISGQSVTLEWQNNSDDKTGFKIFRDDVLIARTNPNVSTFTDTGLNPNTTYTYTVKATDESQEAIDTIVDRHNYYRALEFTDSPLTWNDELANHAQAWADYLAVHYTAADRGSSPHASRFQTNLHNEDDYEEGENIAWGKPTRDYYTQEPIDISSVAVADSYIAGAVDAWASEKAYYDYATNSQKAGYENEAVGHYTQMVWQDTKQIGCGKAKSTTDYEGDWIVCRYAIAGNRSMNGVKEQPYCSNYTKSDLYSEGTFAFTPAMISGKSFAITKVLEDRNACTRTDRADSTLTFTALSSASIPQYDTFNKGDDSNLWNMNFDIVTINEDGTLTLTNEANNRYMTLKIIGDFTTHYSVEAYWWVSEEAYNRRAILKLVK